MTNRILKGTIVFTADKDRLRIYEDSYIRVENGKIVDIVRELDRDLKDENIKIEDYSGKLIIPGFTDLHLHASQYPNMGIGLDKELLPWLDAYTFLEECKYKDLEYAERVFKRFINNLWRVGTLRSVVYSSIHRESTELLLDMFIESGLASYVGKVNMDRNTADCLKEDTEDSIVDTEIILKKYIDKSKIVAPIITPRFAPTCSDILLKGLGELSEKYKLPVQSHLNESKAEIEIVKKLFPNAKDYSTVYDKYKLFGPHAVMAHCIYSTDEEIDAMYRNGVYAAHCPSSNLNLSSGIMPIRKYLDKGVNLGLGTDISAGSSLSIADMIVDAIQSSKVKSLNTDRKLAPLTFSEAFYIATKGGGSFFGKVGSFEEGFEFDALIIDDSKISDIKELSIEERLQKYIYIGDDREIIARYVRGEKIDKPFEISD